ncbi:TPA: GNAT family N-acetyltransferase [Legionella pneumophila]|nr:GNAT family N-acetyltransferase [Legionella pneumophila]HAU0297533.1 GNAT family N-acetyltransferase [Legionella pneumophila]
MIKIDLLKNHLGAIPRLAEIWDEALGSVWEPNLPISEIKSWFYEWLNESIPLAYIALCDGKPVGFCSLQLNDGVRPGLSPWLGDLVVDSKYQKKGIGRMLIDAITNKAQELGFEKLYLYAFDPTIPDFYTSLGWSTIGIDEFKQQPITVMEMIL